MRNNNNNNNSNSNHSRSSSVDSGDDELVKIIHARARGGPLPASQHFSPSNSATSEHQNDGGDEQPSSLSLLSPPVPQRALEGTSSTGTTATAATVASITSDDDDESNIRKKIALANRNNNNHSNINSDNHSDPPSGKDQHQVPPPSAATTAHLEGVPGAYAVAVPPQTQEQQQDQDQEGSTSSSSGNEEAAQEPSNSTTATTSRNGTTDTEHPTTGGNESVVLLAVANLVSDDEEHDEERALPQAQQVDTEEQEKQKKQAAQKAKRILLGGGLALLVVVVVVILVAVLVPNSNDNNDSQQDGEVGVVQDNFSSYITDKNRETHVLNVLPPSTQTTIQANDYSPQYRAYQWTVRDPSLHTYPDWRIQQRYALATFYYATGGGYDESLWDMYGGWLDYTVSECDWYSYTYKAAMAFVQFSESYGYGPDVFPNFEWVQHDNPCDIDPNDEEEQEHPIYRHLWQLQNGLEGSLPDELFLLTNLRSILLFAIGKLEGTVPTYIGQLTNLEAMVLTGSRISGTLPTEMGLFDQDKFRSMLVAENEHTGTIPTELATLTNMESLALSANVSIYGWNHVLFVLLCVLVDTATERAHFVLLSKPLLSKPLMFSRVTETFNRVDTHHSWKSQ